MTRRFRCGGCGALYALTSKGLIRAHTRNGLPVSTFPEAACGGSGMPPIDEGEPTMRDEMRALQARVAELEAYDVEQITRERDAWRAANVALLAALRSMLASDDALRESQRLRLEAEQLVSRAELTEAKAYDALRRRDAMQR